MSNKYSIVTGASRGLGAAIAEELAREGYDVVITYCTQADKAQKVKKQLETKFGVRVESYQLDIKDEEAVLAFRKWVEETLGTNLQVLVNNAGIYANMPAEEIASKTFCDIIDVNVKGTFFMTRHFVDLMIANHYGKIINLCSAVGLRAAPGSIAYASSKFAIRGMTQALAIDLGKYNIQVNAIAPGAHKTDMYWDAYKIDPELLEKRTKGCPLQRAGEVSEMYHIVRYFLASDFITGQVVSPNGGTTILAIVIPTGLLAYCGMNGLVTLIAFYPIALGLMERAGIPKRYVMGLLSFGVYAFALTGPGTAQLVNVLSMQVVGEGPAAGLVGGLVGVVVEIVFGTFVLTLMIKKDVAKGLKFAYGPNDIRVADDKQLPNFLISLIPLLSVVIFFNVVKLDIFSSCLAAWLLSIILLGKYMPKKDGSLLKELLDVCTVSGTNAFGPCGMVGSLFGFVSVVQTLPEFQAILNYIFSLNMAPFLVLILSINIVGALTGSSSSAIRIGMPMAMQHCIDAGMSLAFVQRLGAFAASILDTLPHSSAIIINLGIADQDMKEAYPPMAVTTILTTAVGTAAVAIFMSLFPSLP